MTAQQAPAPRTRRLRIIAQDPAVKLPNGRILTAEVEVPYENLEPGPRGYRVQVVDYDSSTHTLYRAAWPAAGGASYEQASDATLLADPGFHAQNVYAVIMRTLARFEHALGRRVSWSFRGHQIQTAPHAFADANAFYSREQQALMFGYFPGEDGKTVFACLSHDVVAHETAHALVDGLRERYTDPSSPDQAAFHEGFADVVALLSVFALPEVVEILLDFGTARGDKQRIAKEALTLERLRASTLLGLAEQMGREMSAVRGNALRRSVALPATPRYLKMGEFAEPHRRGEIFVAAMLNSFLEVWRRRLASLGEVAPGYYNRGRVVEDGASAANHLLTMSIRALDFCPPTDILFTDFLSALLTADTEIQPDDSRFHYRDALRKVFRSYGIVPTSKGVEGIWEAPVGDLSYQLTHFESMQRDSDEVFRFLWENRRVIGLCEDAFTRVQSVRPCVRIGSDGFLLRETIVEYFQRIDLAASELKFYGIQAPEGMAPATEVPLFGGGALVFDEYGRLKFHIRNSIVNSERQTRRLKYLWQYGAFEAGTSAQQRFSRLHRLKMMDSPLRKVEE